jgi:hypothetical protein
MTNRKPFCQKKKKKKEKGRTSDPPDQSRQGEIQHTGRRYRKITNLAADYFTGRPERSDDDAIKM